ncbi:DUF3237 domain-containing protein ASCRUDRAFT_113817 [Ascoidea rubescens DSM 1968]|uniref:Uncharacterized protein n=1 Tax=Ascoidea rubescens DSM 1968 TaxID=1344418 RepID=A0A1D2VBZ1_9ASCO|nr:hypothetical protein ASCRUDRAFT_113817 [Ascoidea rubescens DSM 1968]ODV59224.1 hypothetical protein ASCRUDRAFT_113817 [Ascoidea rubescens DSM 1968]
MSAPPIPTLKPVIFINIIVDEPSVVYSNDTTSLTYVNIKGGYTKSLDNDLPFDCDIIAGTDHITSINGISNPPVSNLDCRILLKSKKNGGGIEMKYSGVVQINKAIADVFSKASSTMEYTDGYLSNSPYFLLDGSCADEKWVSNQNFIGKGRFVRDQQGNLTVQYYIYIFN